MSLLRGREDKELMIEGKGDRDVRRGRGLMGDKRKDNGCLKGKQEMKMCWGGQVGGEKRLKLGKEN